MDIKKEPLLLVLQIDPTTGNFIESAIHFNLNIEGHKSRHELWWHKITPEGRKNAQKLVNSVIKDMLA